MGGFQREKRRRRKGGGDIAYVVVAKPFSRTRIIPVCDSWSGLEGVFTQTERRALSRKSQPVWYISLSLTLCLAKFHGW
jgi:hypothetical protein